MEKVIFTDPDTKEKIEFYVLEETQINGKKFLFVTEEEDGDSEAYILKEIAYDYIPRELLDRKKTGFSVPLDKWLRGPLKDKLTDYASPAFLKQQGLFNADATAKLITDWLGAGDGGAYTGSNYSRIIWAFFIFQQWAERYLQA